MNPTLPLGIRNHLAELILASLRDAGARTRLAEVAGGEPVDWAGADAQQARGIEERARVAIAALAAVPVSRPEPSLDEVLAGAAALFDAGLHFEVHEWLEPHWYRASGEDREALQGLIQVAVGYQHAANGNQRGARSLLEEGSARLHDRRLAGIDLDPFARAVLDSVRALPLLLDGVPPFPRRA